MVGCISCHKCFSKKLQFFQLPWAFCQNSWKLWQLFTSKSILLVHLCYVLIFALHQPTLQVNTSIQVLKLLNWSLYIYFAGVPQGRLHSCRCSHFLLALIQNPQNLLKDIELWTDRRAQSRSNRVLRISSLLVQVGQYVLCLTWSELGAKCALKYCALLQCTATQILVVEY